MCRLIVCVKCAEIVEVVDHCPKCGAKLLSYNDPIVVTSQAAVRYGFQYKELHEKQERDRNTGTKFFLVELPDIFTWISLTIVSGIVGGASWDTTKSIIRKILSNSDLENIEGPSIERLRNISDEELGYLASCVQEHFGGYQNSTPNVRNELIEEMMVDAIQEHEDLSSELLSITLNGSGTEEENKRRDQIIKEVMSRKFVEQRRSLNRNVSGWWSNIK